MPDVLHGTVEHVMEAQPAHAHRAASCAVFLRDALQVRGDERVQGGQEPRELLQLPLFRLQARFAMRLGSRTSQQACVRLHLLARGPWPSTCFHLHGLEVPTLGWYGCKLGAQLRCISLLLEVARRRWRRPRHASMPLEEAQLRFERA